MEDIKIIRLDETDSTNTFLAKYDGNEGMLMTVVTAECQTAGRGQGSNSWESERGKNLTFSIKTYPKNLMASRQFVLLEAGALAISDTLRTYTDEITVKWPNDVYWRDYKISGTLSECSINGNMVGRCILGTGLNVNQQRFVSDAPNPVSVANIIGCETCREEVLQRCIRNFMKYMDMVNSGHYNEIDMMYAAAMYRKSGVYEYEDDNGRFMAEIKRIEPNGHLVLERSDGTEATYAFKEVRFII